MKVLVGRRIRNTCTTFAAFALLTSAAMPSLAENKFYVNADAGLNFINAERWKVVGVYNIDARFHTGYRFDAAFGYELTKKWNVELELGMAQNKGSTPDQFSAEEVNLYQFPILLNAIYRPNWSPKIKPFAALGAGATVGDVEANRLISAIFPAPPDYHAWAVSPAIQLKAGFELPVTKTLDVQLAYQALLTTSYHWGNFETFGTPLRSGLDLNQSVTAGFRLRF